MSTSKVKEYDFTKEGMVKRCGFESAEELSNFEAQKMAEIAKAFSSIISASGDAEINLYTHGASLTELIENIAKGTPEFFRVLCMQYARTMFNHLIAVEQHIQKQKEADDATDKTH